LPQHQLVPSTGGAASAVRLSGGFATLQVVQWHANMEGSVPEKAS